MKRITQKQVKRDRGHTSVTAPLQCRELHAETRSCPRQESNLHPALRRRVLYPLSYEGREISVPAHHLPPDGHEPFVELGLMFSDTESPICFDHAMEEVLVRHEVGR